MGISDKILGGGMLLAASTVFAYYTAWAMILPFLDSSSSIHGYFPPREWAVRVPAFVLTIGLTAIGLFIGSTIAKENKRKAQKARDRTA